MTPIFAFEMDVRWRDLDALGHVNNSQFLSYIEETRVKWFNAMQDSWQDAESAPVVAAIHVDFRQSILWPERIRIELFAEKRGAKSVTIGHRICSTQNHAQRYAEGYTVLVWIDRQGQSTLPPDYVAALFSP